MHRLLIKRLLMSCIEYTIVAGMHGIIPRISFFLRNKHPIRRITEPTAHFLDKTLIWQIKYIIKILP